MTYAEAIARVPPEIAATAEARAMLYFDEAVEQAAKVIIAAMESSDPSERFRAAVEVLDRRIGKAVNRAVIASPGGGVGGVQVILNLGVGPYEQGRISQSTSPVTIEHSAESQSEISESPAPLRDTRESQSEVISLERPNGEPPRNPS